MDISSPHYKPRLSFKDQVKQRILDFKDPETGIVQTSEPFFHQWLRGMGWVVRDQTVARTVLATFVEYRTFGEPGEAHIKGDSLFIHRRGSNTPHEFELPYWMLKYITSFPKAPWRGRAAKLIALAKAPYRELAK